MNGIHNGCSNLNGLKPNMNGNQNKADDNSMMEEILKGTDSKGSNGQYGSNTNISGQLCGGLPGRRNRIRQTNGSKLFIN